MIGSHNFINFLQYLINGLYNKKQTKYFVDISQLVLDDDISCRHFFEMLTKIAGKTIPFTLILDARKIDPNNFEKFMLGFLSEGKQIPLSLNVISVPKLSKEMKIQLISFFKYQSGPLKLLTIQDLNGEFIFNSRETIYQDIQNLSDEEEEVEEPPRNQPNLGLPRLIGNANLGNNEEDDEEDSEDNDDDEFGEFFEDEEVSFDDDFNQINEDF